MKSVITFESFDANKPVKNELFELSSVLIPVNTRFANHVRDAEHQYLYFDGERLTEKKVRLPILNNRR